MTKAFIDDDNLTDIANAIRGKLNVETQYLPSQMADAIDSIPLLVEEKDVNFYDYEGTLVASYTKEEALALTELPALPDRTAENLTNEGWNMSISDIAERINKGMFYVAVGCTYYTTDNKTHMTVIPDENHTTVYLCIVPSVANDTTIYWGDGSSNTISSASETTLSHTYSSNLFDTEIDLTIESTSGLHQFNKYIGGGESNNKSNKITSIHLSKDSRIIQNGRYTFGYLYYLKNITISKDVYGNNPAMSYLCSNCINLVHINIPSSVILGMCAFENCISLQRASVPKTTSMYGMFTYCSSLDKIDILNFNITSPDSTVKTMYNTYRCCYLRKKAYIDEGNTELLNHVFYMSPMGNFETIVLPSTITSIKSNVFYGNINLKEIYLKATTPPTLDAVFSNINTFYKIYVPRASCAAYKAATNWSDTADNIYPYDYDAIPDSLYFYMPNGGDVTLTKTGSPTEVTLEYSLDCGTTWTTWVESNNVRTLTLTAGETMFIRNTSETTTRFSTGDDGTANNYYMFSLSNITYCGGYLESLINKNPTNATYIGRATFRMLFFYQSNLMTAPKLIGGYITRRSLQQTFAGCDNLQSCDISSITSVGSYGCYGMFTNCSKLNLVKCGITSINTDGIYNWLGNVAATGDLYCPSTLTIPANSTSGIPTGWTRHNID